MELEKIWNDSIKELKLKHNFDLEAHLKSVEVSSVRAKLPAFIKSIIQILGMYKDAIDKINDSNNGTLVNIQIKMLTEAINGGGKELKQGIKYNLMLFFNYGEFRRKLFDRKMIALFINICIDNIAKQVHNDTDTTNLSPYLDIKYLIKELKEEPNKHIN